MNKGLLVCFALVVLGGACTTAPTSIEKKTGRFLCISTEVDGQLMDDCLSAVNAKPAEVRRRLAIYNQDLPKKERVACNNKKTTGSLVTRWRCTRGNNSGNIAIVPIGTLEFIRRGRIER